jgi:hypothetical protein
MSGVAAVQRSLDGRFRAVCRIAVVMTEAAQHGLGPFIGTMARSID